MGRYARLVVMGLTVVSTIMTGVDAGATAEAPFSRRVSATISATSDDRLESVTTEDIVIRAEPAIATFGQILFPINEHFSEMQILEAATLKADGRRLDVPADKILVSSLPNASTLSMYEADVKQTTIVFPDVAVGDTVHYRTRIRDRKRGLDGGFSLMRVIAPSGRFDEFSITLDAPKSLTIKEAQDGFARREEQGEQRRVISWTLKRQDYRADEPGTTAAIDREPYLVFSSYPDWQTVGRKFFDGAAPMSEPSGELKMLADDITQGIDNRRDQARAIFDWVSSNVRYMAIFLGQGGFVPNHATSVYANKYGDCKDHVTLMRALLAAKGIEADYALIALTPVYREPLVPAPDWFNHVILWLPEFDHYVDPTDSLSSFESVSDSDAGKFVLRVGKTEAVLTRTPSLDADSNRLTVVSEVTLAADGTVKGVSTQTASGAAAAKLRGVMAKVAIKGGEDFAKELLSKQNWHGSGNIEARNVTDHADPFTVRSSFELTNKMFGEEAVNRNPIPLGPRLLSPAWSEFYQVWKDKRTQDFVCRSETYQQTIEFRLPEGKTLAKIPDDIDFRLTTAAFESHYRLDGSILHIERRMTTRVPGQACPAQIAYDMAPVLEAAFRDISWRPQFQHP